MAIHVTVGVKEGAGKRSSAGKGVFLILAEHLSQRQCGSIRINFSGLLTHLSNEKERESHF